MARSPAYQSVRLISMLTGERPMSVPPSSGRLGSLRPPSATDVLAGEEHSVRNVVHSVFAQGSHGINAHGMPRRARGCHSRYGNQ